MFNPKEFFSKPEPVALSIEPYLSFLSIGKEVKVIIDSGEEDMNQKVAQTRLDEKQSANISRLFVRGFDTIYHDFPDHLVPESLVIPDDVLNQPVDVNITKNLSKDLDVKDIAEPATDSLETQPAGLPKNILTMDLLQAHLFPADEYHADRNIDAALITNIKDAFEHEEGIVFGQVCLELGNKEIFVVASPIYTVVPSDTEEGLEFVTIETAKAYISEEWRSEFASALVLMNSESSDASPARTESRRRDSGNNTSKAKKIGIVLGSILFVSLCVTAFAMALNSGTSNTQAKAKPAPFSSLMPHETASASTGAGYDPYALSTTGMPSPEQMAQMQTAAMNNVFQGMNVDINSTSDLGCLSQ